MKTTWIVIADRSGARILRHQGTSHGLQLAAEIAHPEGRLRPREIEADRPGRVHDRMGSHRHGVAREEAPTEHLAKAFAHDIAERLRKARLERQFEALVLVAGPHLLGHLREALDAPTAALVSAELHKDLQDVPVDDLPRHLADVVPL